jgi:glycosyltransferase involved in cell wall biosynthesis
MRVAFVLPTLESSGGVRTVVEHALRLSENDGYEIAVVVCDGAVAAREIGLRVRMLTAVHAAEMDWDIAVATWWTTWPAAAELRAARRVLFLQGLDERFYRDGAPLERMAAALALGGPDHVIAVSAHLAEVIRALRPGVGCDVVRNGLDRGVFSPASPRSPGGPLRILVEGHPGLWIKGVGDALTAVGLMREPVHVTLAALNRAAGAELDVDRVVGGLDAHGMAAVYRDADVLLKLSRTEGLGLPPLEAAAVGRPSVVTPYGGHADWLRHGANGVLVGFDDQVGTAAWLDCLARDRPLLRRLGAGALEMARAWPTPREASDQLAGVLERIAASPAPDPIEPQRASARALARGLEVGRPTVAHIAGALDDLARQRTLNAELISGNRALVAQKEEAVQRAEERLTLVLESRAYRTGLALRAVWTKVHAALRPFVSIARRLHLDRR